MPPSNARFRRLQALERFLLFIPLGTAGALLGFAESDLNPLFAYPAMATWLIAVVSLVLPNNPLGPQIPLALGLITLLCCGTSPYLHNFGLGCSLYVASAMVALQSTSASAWRSLPRRGVLGAAAVTVVSLTIGGLLYSHGDGMFWWAHGQLRRWSVDPSVGFDSDPISLTGLRGVYLSESMVLRIHGPTPRHLRGAVYDRYQAGRWTSRPADPKRWTLIRRIPPEDQPVIRVNYVGSRTRHLFLPYPIGSITAEDRGIFYDEFGVLRLIPPARTSQYEFSLAGVDLYGPGRPGEGERSVQDDLFVHAGLAPELDRWLDQHVDRSLSPRALADEIDRILSDEYQYSLEFEREFRTDPLIEFLWEDRTGHCEYFASAMVLLARQAGIPARMVAGYFVSERSSLSDYAVVRERDAHAWAEVYLPEEGWVTFDPSPRVALESKRGLFGWRAWWDAIKVYWQWILIGLLPIGLGSLAFSVWWRKRKPRRSRTVVDLLAYESPPDAFQAFESRLAAQGLARSTTTPLTEWSHELREAGQPDASELVLAYSQERYSSGKVSTEWQRNAEDWLSANNVRSE